MLKVIKSGLWTSIQDQGRFGFKHLGVPTAGCMDQYSAGLANRLLNNSSDAAVLEITIIGPSLRFQGDSQICLCGADISPKLNNKSIANNVAIAIKADDLLTFEHLNYGARAYLAIKNGFQTELEMESRSYCQNITAQQTVEKSDLLDYPNIKLNDFTERAHVKIDSQHFNSIDIECLAGPEYDYLKPEQKKLLIQDSFSLSVDHTRMGFQLNEVLDNSCEPILSSAVIPGTVQLTPAGKLIILMRDCQTTGGYPRVLQLSENAVNRLSQKKPGDKIRFKMKAKD